ncbi:MAG: DNA repair and recombination protein RadB [Candidatus Pacearchaeota archaeon]|nr:DNA repair and recombination protein RadB [Candidatus Pacearchaeota archaeon]
MAKISAGSYDLNKWLYGGYEEDIISVIYGGPGSGKTNFCLLAAVSQAKKGKKVIFMDSEGGFSVERVKQLALGEYEKVMENILLLKPTNFVEQKKDFEKLLEYLNKEVGLIVVDSITILYRLELASARENDESSVGKINSELVKQLRILAEIARKRKIPVIVTSQVYNWEDSQKMVAGDILKYWGKCLIELKNEKGKRVAILRKHRSLKERELEFEIINEGIKKRGWI